MKFYLLWIYRKICGLLTQRYFTMDLINWLINSIGPGQLTCHIHYVVRTEKKTALRFVVWIENINSRLKLLKCIIHFRTTRWLCYSFYFINFKWLELLYDFILCFKNIIKELTYLIVHLYVTSVYLDQGICIHFMQLEKASGEHFSC